MPEDAAAIFTSSSPRLCSVCCHTVHAIASRSFFRPVAPSLRAREGRPPRPPLGDAIATTSPPSRHQSTSNQEGSAPGCLSSCPPRPLPLFQVVRVRAEHQPRRASPCRSSCRPSPPCRGRPTAPRLALLEV